MPVEVTRASTTFKDEPWYKASQAARTSLAPTAPVGQPGPVPERAVTVPQTRTYQKAAGEFKKKLEAEGEKVTDIKYEQGKIVATVQKTTRQPTAFERAAAGERYNPYARKTDVVDYTTTKAGVTAQVTTTPTQMGQVTAVREHPSQQYSEVMRQEKIAKQRDRIVRERMTTLETTARTDPGKYGVQYATSAWAAGPISAAGIGLRTVARYTLIEDKQIAKQLELRAFAERTLALEQRPVEYIAKGMAQVPIVAGISYVMGTVGAKLAYSHVGTAKAFSVGTKVLAGGATVAYVGPPIVKGDYVEAVGRVGETLAAAPFAYYGYKAGVTRVVRQEYIKQFGVPEKQLKLAERLGQLPQRKPKPLGEVIKEIPIMQKKGG